ncbi:MAG: hypothetical protein JO055_13290 [Alphaproteobacteria bacterium]|nr:hypothetical protein [Alphaproteobacteria bacterium]
MMLGQMIERLGDEAFAAEAMIALGDLALMVEIDAAARSFEVTPAAYAIFAAQGFASHASDDDWLALMTAMERAEDPGTACLKHMLVWSLRHDSGSCDCHHA